MTAEAFARLFGRAPAARNATPGRVNLIGEHLDYNGGAVLPAALTIGVETFLAPRTDARFRVTSDRFVGAVDSTQADASPDWAKHALGALAYAWAGGLLEDGADLLITSTMPDGAGLSSSAALIVSILKAARALSGVSLDDTAIALLAQRVENEHVGLPCGIMDQMAVAIAKPGEALALDTKTLRREVVPLPPDHRFVVIHSGVQRRLAEGRYAVRRAECEAARAALGVEDLCLMDDAAASRISALPDDVGRRARHCLSEHRRTLAAIAALKSGDVDHFGALMNESHASMRDDFAMSMPQIDSLVADAQMFGALGARLTGGGFGGSIVALVANTQATDWTRRLLAAHPAARAIA
jgi:galactokinase